MSFYYQKRVSDYVPTAITSFEGFRGTKGLCISSAPTDQVSISAEDIYGRESYNLYKSRTFCSDAFPLG